MNFIKNIILLPFFPFRLGWKVASSRDAKPGQRLFALIAIPIIIYGLIFELVKITFFDGKSSSSPAAIEQSAEK